MLIQLKNGKPIGHPVMEDNFRSLFPSTSFPSQLSPADVEPFKFGIYEFTVQPAPERFQKVVEATPAQDKDGIWRQKWTVVEMSESEQQAETLRKAEEVRNERALRMAACDWTQLPDAPVNAAAWSAYRRALRDVTLQKGFPWDVAWPTTPSPEG